MSGSQNTIRAGKSNLAANYKRWLALGLLQCTLLTAQAERLLIENVRLFDGREVHPQAQVLIDGTQILSIQATEQQTAGARRIDGRGKTLLPGLIDGHVHAYKSQDLPLLYGVTTQIDMFSDVRLMQQFHQHEVKDNKHADIYSAGILATAPGGHGTEYGLAIPTLTSPDQAEAWVAARIAEGSHFIKIVVEGQGNFKSLNRETVAALVQAAHRHQKLAVAHIGNLQEARLALEAGVDGLVHLFLGSALSDADLKEFVQLCRTHQAFVIPTFSVLNSMAGLRADDLLQQPALIGLLNHTERASLLQVYGKQPHPELLAAARQVTAALQKAGVPILAGTDAGNNGTQYGISMHHELAQLVNAGLTPAQALQAASANVAERFGLTDRGRVAPGMRADLLLVEGVPDQDIHDSSRIVKVWKAGQDVTELRHDKLRTLALSQQQQKPALTLPQDGQLIVMRKQSITSPIGLGWIATSDQFVGGQSRASFKPGNNPQQASIVVQAEIKAGFPFPWAGLALVCGAQAMQGENLSTAKFLRFKIRGDGQAYQLALSTAGQQIPVTHTLSTGSEWREYNLALSQFPQVDWTNLSMIAFQAYGKPGHYEYEVADIRLSSE